MFVTFEGSEGSGKTTQIHLLAEFLVEQDLSVVITREPGGTHIAEQIREVLHNVHNTAMSSEAEILLYSAARAQHVRELIRPALTAGHIVLCDRFADSTMAYQGYGRQLNISHLQMITNFATGGLTPDLTFFFNIDVEIGLQRRMHGQLEMNRMDLQKRSFYERVSHGYKTLIAAEPQRWVVIEANRPINEIQDDVRTLFQEKLLHFRSP